MTFRDRTFGAPRRAPAQVYPVAQWRHGNPGGLEIPTRYFPDPQALKGLPKPVELAHGENTEEAWLLPACHLAVVGFRPVRWERRRGEIVEAAPPDLASPWEAGYRSRRRFLVVVRELWNAGYRGFTVATFRATSSQDISRALHAASRFRTSAGKSAGGTAFPEYAFWLPIRAGKVTRVYGKDGGQSSLITPIECLLPEKPTEEDYERLVIPEEVQAFIEERLEEVSAWENEENGVQGKTVEPPAEAAEEEPTEETEEAEEEAPAEEPEEDLFPEEAPAPVGKKARPSPPDYLRMVVPFGTKQHPEFRGMPLGDILATPDGRRFVRYLADQHRPRNPAEEELVKAARALTLVGLARG